MASADIGYRIYRGKCKEACEALQKVIPELRLVRGHYYCPIWNSNEPHWWLEDEVGNIIDPTVHQFPSSYSATREFYTEFDGICDCENCGKPFKEEDGVLMGRFMVCSDRCACELVGGPFSG